MSKLLPEAALARAQAFARHVRHDDRAQLDAWLVVLADDLGDAAWRSLPRGEGWRMQFLKSCALKRHGAGAFLAVAQGNESDDAGGTP